jgi:CRP/FNR family cyclic AMP-dependent transcriptional regulator
MAQDAKLDRLAGIPLFSGAERRQLERLAALCTEVDVPEGRVLCREGEPGHEFFVIADGTAVVSVGGRDVATLRTGDFFGELALLDGRARTATVTANSAMRVLVLSRAEFSAMVHEDPIVAVRMLPAIGARLRAQVSPTEQPSPVV